MIKKRAVRFPMVLCGLLLIAATSYGIYHTQGMTDKQRQERARLYKLECKNFADVQDWEGMKAHAEEWLAWNPESDEARVYLAEACLQLDELRKAADLLGEVSPAYHGALKAFSIRGDILFSDLNLPYEAVETWKKMLEMHSAAAVAHQPFGAAEFGKIS